MQVTTPKGRWLVPPDRAVWVPARFVHAIDVLADIEMRTLYFDLAWLKRERHGASLASEFVVRVSPLLHQAILALFDDGKTPRAHGAADQARDAGAATAPRIPRPSSRCRRSRAAAAPPTSCCARPPPRTRSRRWRAKVGTSARTLSRLFSAETQLSFKSWCQRARIASAIERLSTRAQCLGETARRRSRLCQRPRVFPRVPAGDRQDADGICGNASERATPTAVIARERNPV